MRSINQSHLFRQHKGKWVALKADRRTVVAAGRSVKSVQKAAEDKGVRKPVITRVPKAFRNFVGCFMR